MTLTKVSRKITYLQQTACCEILEDPELVPHQDKEYFSLLHTIRATLCFFIRVHYVITWVLAPRLT